MTTPTPAVEDLDRLESAKAWPAALLAANAVIALGEARLRATEARATTAEALAKEQAETIGALTAEVKRLSGMINTPEIVDFIGGVHLEAVHQRQRWAAEVDAGKAPLDWFWLIGYLAQKAATAQIAGDTDKALHHTISTAAALANWHAAISGANTDMRPGIEPPALSRTRPSGGDADGGVG